MALIKGICKNFGECDLADNKEVQEVEKSNFVCEECGKPLHSIGNTAGGGRTDDGPNKSFLGIFIAVLVLLGGGGAGVWMWWTNRISPEDYKLIVTPDVVTMKVGDRIQLKGSVEPDDAKVTYKWRCTNKKIATVTSDGELTALGAGETSITLRIEDAEKPRAFCRVIIEGEPDTTEDPDTGIVYVEQITVTPKAIAMTPGETRELVASSTPQPNSESINYDVSDETIISYEAGKVKALKPGKASIVFIANLSGMQETVDINVVGKKNTSQTIRETKTGGSAQAAPAGPARPQNHSQSGRQRGTLDLGYARFSGNILNGKPDGAGILTYKGRHAAGRNFVSGEQVYAEAGESVDGVWNAGYLTSGTLIKKDGNVIKIKY